MRTLLEILEAAKDGDKPTHDECYFAMLALDGLSNFTCSDLRNLAFKDDGRPARDRAEEDHRRWKQALRMAPDAYLGPGFTPGRPEHDDRRRLAKAVLAAVERGGA